MNEFFSDYVSSEAKMRTAVIISFNNECFALNLLSYRIEFCRVLES